MLTVDLLEYQQLKAIFDQVNTRLISQLMVFQVFSKNYFLNGTIISTSCPIVSCFPSYLPFKFEQSTIVVIIRKINNIAIVVHIAKAGSSL